MIYRLDAADAAICDIVGIVFFFKQKTAYELRISDWSSDVCSSDLKLRHARRQAVVERRAAIAVRIVQDHTKTGVPEAVLKREFPADRKSVVSGKSVSVRVELGGRRTIKQKNHPYLIRDNI